MADGQLTTDTSLYPAYTDKNELLEELYFADTPEDLRAVGHRVGNTNFTGILSNPTQTMVSWESGVLNANG